MIGDGAAQGQEQAALAVHVLAAAPDAVFVSGLESRRIVHANAAAVRLVGLDEAELTGQSLDELCVALLPSTSSALRASLERTGASVLETRLRRSNGRELPVRIESRVLPGMSPALYASYVHASSERAVADLLEEGCAGEDELAASSKREEQLRQAQKLEAIGLLAGGVAHDFNNLLTVIRGVCQLLRIDQADAVPRRPVVEDLQTIDDAAAQAELLTRQLLAFGRKQVLAPRTIDLNALIRRNQRIMQRLIGEDIVIECQLVAEQPHVCFDPGQLQQVLMNLAANARDAMPRGGKLTIATRNEPTSGVTADERPPAPTRVLLSFADTGHGMSPDVMARIFDPFFTTKIQRGTGLGLATVHGIIEQSGGSIRVDSAVGRGSTFVIELPVSDGKLDGDHPAPPVGQRGSERILVVEDDASVRALTVRVLVEAGYTTFEAEDASGAVAILASTGAELDLLLTDVIMRDGTGPDLAAAARALRPRLSVLFMSGYTHDALEDRGIFVDAGALLEKPFAPALLLTRVREVLETARAGGPTAELEAGEGA